MRWLFAIGNQSFILGNDARFRNDIAHNKVAVAWVLDLDAAKHLANDNLEMLVSHVLTLRGVDAQHFVDDIALSCLGALQTHQVVQVERADCQAVACLNVVISRYH